MFKRILIPKTSSVTLLPFEKTLDVRVTVHTHVVEHDRGVETDQ